MPPSKEEPRSSGQASPPTARAVAVVEVLVGTGRPMSVSEVTSHLGINRSTCTSILNTLEELQWVERVADRSYQPGPGLIPVANAVRRQLPILSAAEPIMRVLADGAAAEAVTLSRVDSGFVTLVEKTSRRPSAYAPPSFRLPMYPPFGAACAAFDTAAGQRQWLEQVDDLGVRDHLRRLLDTVRRIGVAVWRLDRSGQLLQDAVTASEDVAPTLGLHRGAAASDRRIAALSIALGRAGYTAEELERAAQPFAVSYMQATVFDEVDRPCYLLELHVLRTDVTYAELRTLVTRVRAAADDLTRQCGGNADGFAWAPVGSVPHATLDLK